MARRPDDDPLECDTCSDPHLRNGRRTCSAHKRVHGRRVQCNNYPIRGGTVCRQTHGGNAPQVRAAAAERLREEAVAEIVRLVVKDVDPKHMGRTPDEQLLEEVARSAQMVEWLAERVADLDVPDLRDTGAFQGLVGVDPDTGEPIEQQNRNLLFGPDHTGDAAPHLYWAMLNAERDRHVKMAKMAIDAGISERMVRLAESQGREIVRVIVESIDAVPGLTAEQKAAAKRTAALRLRALGAGQSPRVIDQ